RLIQDQFERVGRRRIAGVRHLPRGVRDRGVHEVEVLDRRILDAWAGDVAVFDARVLDRRTDDAGVGFSDGARPFVFDTRVLDPRVFDRRRGGSAADNRREDLDAVDVLVLDRRV